MRRPTPLAQLLACGLIALAAPGCPGQLQAPGPGAGTPCHMLEDCNPGRTCGDLVLCVDGLCEATPSLVRPCPGEGVRPSE